MDRRRSVAEQCGLVHRARVPLVGVERPVRVAARRWARISRSRTTLARMLAVATLRHRRSAFTASSTCGTDGDTKSHFPSVTATSGSTPSPSMARRAASFCAADMPRWSHSSWLTEPTDQATHHSVKRSNSASRSRSLSSFESRTPLTRVSRGRIAAPTDSGPAQAPRPTSSMPTTTSWPRSHISFSIARVGARFFDCFGRGRSSRPHRSPRSMLTPMTRRLRRRCPQRLARRRIARPRRIDRRCRQALEVRRAAPTAPPGVRRASARANETVDRGPVGTPCTSKLAPNHRCGIPSGSSRPPSAMRCSTCDTNRPTDAPRRMSENDAGPPPHRRAPRPSRTRRSRRRAMSPAARSSPADTARRSHADSTASTSGSSERAIAAIGSTISGIQASASSPSRPSSATSNRNPIGSHRIDRTLRAAGRSERRRGPRRGRRRAARRRLARCDAPSTNRGRPPWPERRPAAPRRRCGPGRAARRPGSRTGDRPGARSSPPAGRCRGSGRRPAGAR